MLFLSNAWCVAALSSELSADKLLARTIHNRPLVLYREPNGSVVALDDRCPHRFAPLSRGRLLDGTIECPYHGLRFGPSGTCVFNPHGDGRIPAGAVVRRYAAREQDGAIWLWPGDPTLAAGAPPPRFEFLDATRNFVSEGYLLTRANYQLSVDNLLDLSHLQYLHPNTLGSHTRKPADVRCFADQHTVRVQREMRGETLGPLIASAFGLPAGVHADHWLDVSWQPPGLMTILVGVHEDGAPLEHARVSASAHWLTPETANTSHYFFALGLPQSLGEAGRVLLQSSMENLITPFRDEDLPMLEAQQRAIGAQDFWSLRPALLPIDTGAVRARRLMERLIAAEAEGTRETAHASAARS
jgi:phenylpropionate dioxygenase-like ring-hydroxylating dioxygenase large terminal subunit